jgi:hypothetical protein
MELRISFFIARTVLEDLRKRYGVEPDFGTGDIIPIAAIGGAAEIASPVSTSPHNAEAMHLDRRCEVGFQPIDAAVHGGQSNHEYLLLSDTL